MSMNSLFTIQFSFQFYGKIVEGMQVTIMKKKKKSNDHETPKRYQEKK